MPEMSVLAAPPLPGSMPEAPEPPGSMPRLSMGLSTEKPAGAPKGLQIRVAEGQSKGGKPAVKGLKPGKPPAPFRRRPKLGLVAKAGVGVLVLAITIGGFFFYRIFFPAPSQVVVIKSAPIAKPVPKQTMADVLAKAAGAPGKMVVNGESAIAASRAAAQAKVDALAAGEDVPTPVPTSINDASQSVMAQADLTTDVKVNNTLIQAAPAASEPFRTFVANASIGGVFQGTPSRAIVNGRIVREGQVIDNQLGVMFDRIDATKKMIYFKDGTNAEVSKNY